MLALVLAAVLAAANIVAGVAAMNEGKRVYFALKELAEVMAIRERVKTALLTVAEGLVIVLAVPCAIAYGLVVLGWVVFCLNRFSAENWALFPTWFEGRGKKEDRNDV